MGAIAVSDPLYFYVRVIFCFGLSGIDPVSRNLGPVSRDLGPVSRDIGPVSRDIGPVSRNIGPVSRDMGPISCNIGPVSRDIGPVSCDICPVSRNIGLVSRNIGPVSCNIGPVSRNIGPVSRNIDPVSRDTGPIPLGPKQEVTQTYKYMESKTAIAPQYVSLILKFTIAIYLLLAYLCNAAYCTILTLVSYSNCFRNKLQPRYLFAYCC